MNRSAVIVVIAIAIAVIAAVATYSSIQPTGVSESQQVTIRIAYNKFIDSMPFFVALEKGYFSDAHIKIETNVQQDASFITRALLADQADIGLPISLADVLLIEEKDPTKLKVFMGAAETKTNSIVSILVKPDSQYTSVNDLRGKKLATVPGGIIFAKMMFKKFFDPDDIQYIQMSPLEWLSALSTNQVDAIFSVEPFSTMAINNGAAKSILDSALANSINDPYVAVGFAFTTNFINKNPETAKKIIEIMKRAANYMDENPEESRKILAKYADLPEDLTAHLGWSKYIEAYRVEKEIQLVADQMYEQNFLQKQVYVKEMLYTP